MGVPRMAVTIEPPVPLDEMSLGTLMERRNRLLNELEVRISMGTGFSVITAFEQAIRLVRAEILTRMVMVCPHCGRTIADESIRHYSI